MAVNRPILGEISINRALKGELFSKVRTVIIAYKKKGVLATKIAKDISVLR